MQVGGVDQLLELVETGVGITEHKTRSYPLAVYYGEDDLPEVTTSKVHLVTHASMLRCHVGTWMHTGLASSECSCIGLGDLMGLQQMLTVLLS